MTREQSDGRVVPEGQRKLTRTRGTSSRWGGKATTVKQQERPDTLVWRRPLAYNESPIVGVNWLQANDFCSWRTDRVNEKLLIDRGVLKWDPNQLNAENFN